MNFQVVAECSLFNYNQYIFYVWRILTRGGMLNEKENISRMMAAILFFGLSVQPEVSGTSEIDASGFGDGTGMQPETEEIADMPAAGAGDSISEATAVSIGKTYEGSITTTNTADVYKFTLNSSGNLTIESTALIPWINYYLYDSTGKSIWSSWYSEGTAGQCNISEEFDLTKGTYYLGIEQYGKHTGNYSFELAPSSVISGDANGLILYEGEWIFVANGVIQSQHTGLALYDGEWFYINKGKLDTTINRLVEYDGGLFVVAVGRIVREVNGLWQNPADGLWYYVAEGQVQKQYTGAAQYDGSWFYIIEGKLASNFNGTIVYDGATFKVVAGQLY